MKNSKEQKIHAMVIVKNRVESLTKRLDYTKASNYRNNYLKKFKFNYCPIVWMSGYLTIKKPNKESTRLETEMNT